VLGDGRSRPEFLRPKTSTRYSTVWGSPALWTCRPTQEKGSTTNASSSSRGKAINEKVSLYASVGKALISARESGEDPYAVVEELMGWERFVASVEEAEGLAMPADFDYLDHLQNQYRRLRGRTSHRTCA
jgi:hypothetical protein